MKRIRCLIMLLTVVLVFTLSPATAMAGTLTQYIDQNGDTQSVDATPIDGATGTLDAGWYVISGSVSRTGTIAVIGDAKLILTDDSSLTVTGTDTDAGINISGGSLTIYGQSKGNGQLTAIGTGGGAGIGSGKDAADGGTVNIGGGTVTATGNGGGAGIGGGSGSVGCLVNIRGGIVTATGIDGGAGIGGGKSGEGSTVSIRGGMVTGNGINGGSGIGTGDSGTSGVITIGGGSVKPSSFGGTVLNKPAAEGGEAAYLTTITLADASNTAVADAAIAQLGIVDQTYGTKDVRTDANGKLYLYLSKDAKTTAAQTTDGAATPAYTNYRGSVVTKNDGTAAGTLKVGEPSAQTMAVGGQVRFTAATLGFGQLPITGATSVNTAIATVKLSSGAVTVSGVSAGSTSVAVTYSNGSTESVSVRVYATEFAVTTDNPLGYHYNPGDGAFVFTEPGEYTVSMKSGVTTTTANKIQINGGTSADPIVITLNNVKIQNGGPPFDLLNSSCVELKMPTGTASTMTSSGISSPGIHCEPGTKLIIDGPGALTATGGIYGAGIGGGSMKNCGEVVINGGTITAVGTEGGAGIGGGHYSGDGGTVTINGGTVTAIAGNITGDYGDPGAGIGGGGYYGDGGTVTITGGTVTAIGGNKYRKGSYEYLDIWEGGAGIGGGSVGGEGGTVVITGGSVKVTKGYRADGIGGGSEATDTGTLTNGHQAVSVRALYNVVSATNPQTVTYDIPLVSGGNKISYMYTGTGHGNNNTNLYFYLPLGEFTTTELVSSRNPANPGDSVTFTVTVTKDSGSPATSGDVEFYDGDTLIGTVAVDYTGTATFMTSSLTAARHSIKAKYCGLVNQCFGSYSDVMTQRVVNEPILDISAADVNITSGGTYRITGSTTEHAITIGTSSAVTVILDNVSIDFETSSYYRIPFDSGANVTLLLEGTNAFTCYPKASSTYSTNQPAIKVEGMEKLTIDNDTGGTGSLTVVGGYYMPGIGGSYRQVSGAVTIQGGTVYATGGEHGAGIGGGETVMGGVLTITGGTVIAQGGNWASGIGGGSAGAGGAVCISGGYVNATGGESGAGVGGGHNGAGGIVTITNGTVTATGGAKGAGVGGGYNGAGGTVTITGGSIKANPGSTNAAAMGQGGYASESGTVTNGFEAVSLRAIADMVDAEDPQDISFEASVASNGNTYTYRYTGKGHGDGDTNLYFYLPEAIAVGAPSAETLRDSETGIEVAGNLSEGAVLSINEFTLDQSMYHSPFDQWLNDEDYVPLLGVNISLSGSYTGALTISIPVDTQYNGKTITIVHLRNDAKLETFTPTVADGKATFTVTSLSPFAVFAPVSYVLDDIPKVGDNSAPWFWWLLCGVSAASVVSLEVLDKKRRAYKH